MFNLFYELLYEIIQFLQFVCKLNRVSQNFFMQ